MDPRLDEILRFLSPAGIGALQLVLTLHTRAAMTRGYHPSNPEESKALSAAMRRLTPQDLGVLVLRLDASMGPGLRDFFVVEGELRQRTILGWLYRGMLPNHTPDIVRISYAEEPVK